MRHALRKRPGGLPLVRGAVASIIVLPAVKDISYTLPLVGEVQLSPGQGGVIGAIFAAGLCAWIERVLRGKVPDAVDILVTPTLALLISGMATIYIFMFVAGEISEGIGAGAVWLLKYSGVAAGFILGGLFLPLVMLGLHQALIPIHATLIEQLGFTPLLTILAMAGAGQVGAVAGAFNQFGAPFGATAIGPSSWALLPLLQSDKGQGYAIMAYLVGLVSGYIAGFVISYFWGFPPALMEEHNVGDDEYDQVPLLEDDSDKNEGVAVGASATGSA